MMEKLREQRAIWLIIYGVLIGLIAGGILFLFLSPKQEFAIELGATATAPAVWVEVEGAVLAPGVYAMAEGARVGDVIAKAGGLMENADTVALNLVMPVYDGMQFFVPLEGEEHATGDGATDAFDGQNDFEDFVNINLAGLDDLMDLPMIGESKAQAILDYRDEFGYFERVEDVMQVPGIGEGIYGAISELITIY